MINKILKKLKEKTQGIIIVQVMVFSAVALMMIAALSSWAATSIKAGTIIYSREQAFQSSEAGIDYYRWHLAHSPSDYQDGTTGSGPYVHALLDKNGNTVGHFSLTISPPASGSTLVKIKSVGSSAQNSSYVREIESQVAKPSIADHAFVSNANMRFGEGTEVFGPIHSNGGIRFDGLAHNLVTSGVATYTDTDSDACTGAKSYGVHTCVSPKDPTSPTKLPSRPDVFAAGRQMSQPTIDFSGFASDMSNLKTLAQSSSGFYLDAAGTGYVGYHMVLKTNGTFDLYKISAWASLGLCSSSPSGTPSWSVGTETLVGNYNFPSNGIIFLQDNIVIDGQIDGARLTIAAALLPAPTDTSKYKNIIINNNLLYTNFDGTDSLGLVGQGGVMVGLNSADQLTIDGALMAQNNIVGRFYYNGTGNRCPNKSQTSITLYGMIASYGRYGFAYSDGTGYTTRNINYDANLLYAPPPSFPLTSDQYQILSWQEVYN